MSIFHPNLGQHGLPLTLTCALGLVGPLAMAQITVTPATPATWAGESLELMTTRADGQTSRLTWWVASGGGLIEPGPDGRATYHAPWVPTDRIAWVAVQDPGLPQAITRVPIHILVPPEGPLAWSPVLPQSRNRGQAGTGEALRLFAGSLQAPPEGQQGDFCMILAVRPVEQDPAMGALNGQWLVGDTEGMSVVSDQGQVAPLLQLNGAAGIGAIATRPPTSAGSNPMHVVFTEATRDRASLWSLQTDWTVHLLAGIGHHGESAEPWYRDGAGAQARFGRIAALAMDKHGNVYVADAGNRLIRKVTPSGWTSTVAGLPMWSHAQSAGVPSREPGLARDGYGSEASFEQIRGMVLDERHNCLYVADGNRIRQVSLRDHGEDAQVTTLLGHERGGRGTANDRPQGAIPLGADCLDGPVDLQLLSGTLVIADQNNHTIKAFNPRTRAYSVLLGDSNQPQERLGPRWATSSMVASGQAATLNAPSVIATREPGTLLVGLDYGLGRIDFSTAQIPTPARGSAGK